MYVSFVIADVVLVQSTAKKRLDTPQALITDYWLVSISYANWRHVTYIRIWRLEITNKV